MNTPEIKKTLLILLTILISPILLIAVLLKKQKRDFSETNIIVFPQLTRIGDFICTTPMYRELKSKYPRSHITVLLQGRISILAKCNPYIDDVILYKSSSFLKTISSIIRGRYDIAINPSTTALASALSLLSLSVLRIKLTRDNPPLLEKITDFFNNTKIHYFNHTHLPSAYLRLLAPLGIKTFDFKPDVCSSEGAKEEVDLFFRKYNISKDKILMGMSLTAGNKIKEWGDEKFFELAKMLIKNFNAGLLIIGGEADRERIESFVDLFGTGKERVFPVIGMRLDYLPELVKQLNLFIAVDTGLIYMANALFVPLVDIVGPVDAREQPPQDERSMVVKPAGEVPPSSFVMKKRGKPEEHIRALKATSVESVYNACEKLLRT